MPASSMHRASSSDHWDRIYQDRPAQRVSWYQEHARQSLELIHATGAATQAAIIDVGAGASTLVDDLLAEGYSRLTALDLSAAALTVAQARLGTRAREVSWISADVTRVAFTPQAWDIWHDRAVFHFLTQAEDRQRYLRNLSLSIKPAGHVIVATFALDGPEQCSGLPVARYSAETLQAEFGPAFTLLRQAREAHRTPSGAVQPFTYCLFRHATNAGTGSATGSTP